jgi:hypothetical protein
MILVIFVYFLKFPATIEGLCQKKYVEDDTHGKDVANRRYFFAFVESGHLRSNVSGSATTVEDIVIRVNIGSKSKIHQDGLQIFPKHYVLGFDVSVHDVMLMQVFKSLYQPLQYGPDLSNAEMTFSFVDLVMEMPSIQ